MTDRVKVTISLPRVVAEALRAMADDGYRGNASAVIREALATSPVTKSRFPLPVRRTPAR
jgi:hypothetical protein